MVTPTRRPPQVGDKAPELELVLGKDLPTGKAKKWRLSEAVRQGPVVVAFFPGTFTSTCTDEMHCFTRDWNQYASLGAQFMGVSADSAPSQRAWTEKHGYKVPFGSDFEKTAIRAWGLEDTFWWGQVSKRATFVIDRHGVIRFAEVLPNADLEPTYDAIRSALQNL